MQGVCVQGYCFWTISDNWEWADGYGPKFGLVAVDRHKNLARNPRPSYNLYSEVITMFNFSLGYGFYFCITVFVAKVLFKYVVHLCTKSHMGLILTMRIGFFLQLSKTGKVTKKQRNGVWEDLQDQARQGKTRPFCRQTNSMGLMFAGTNSVFI